MRRQLRPGLCSVFIGAILAVVSTLLPPATPARAAGFDVTRFDDVSLGDCTPDDCSLREAIMAANQTPGLDVIRLPAGIYSLSFPGRHENVAHTGDLDITDVVSIYGAGADRTTIFAYGIDRVFDVRPGVSGTVIISGLTIAGGDVATDHGPFDQPEAGGGIRIASTTQLFDVEIRGNAAFTGGGIAHEGGTLLLSGSTVAENRAFRHGGGIAAESGTLNVTRTTISGNSTTEVDPSNVLSGSAGGLWTRVATTLRNVTIGPNTASGLGDAITTVFSDIRPELWNTIVDRRADAGAIACLGSISSRDNNIFRDDSCSLAYLLRPGDRVSVDPRLAPLRLYGGPTRTQLLLPGSPAIDAGANATCTTPTDQRRVAVPQDGNGDGAAICDSGAVEVVPTVDHADIQVTITDDVSIIRPSDGLRYTIVVTNRGPAAAIVNVFDLFPFDLLTDVRWACTATSGSSCGRDNGLADINGVLVTLASGGQATFLARGTVRSTATGTLANTARVIINPDLPVDVQPDNNMAIDTDTIVAVFPIVVDPLPTPTPFPAPGPTPTLAPPGCAPRPEIRLAVVPAGAGRLQVTLTAATSAALPSNGLRELRVGASSNALVDVPGFVTGARDPFSVGLLFTTTVTFFVRRDVPGLPTTVPLVVVDDCGEWPTFVGGGPTAF